MNCCFLQIDYKPDSAKYLKYAKQTHLGQWPLFALRARTRYVKDKILSVTKQTHYPVSYCTSTQ